MPGVLDSLRVPVVQAPMAGGTSTVALAAAVSEAGGLGFLAAGYRTADGVREEIATLRAATSRPFGVNLFLPTPRTDLERLAAYSASVRVDAEAHGLPVGEPRWTDDAWEAKLEVVLDERPPVVSFTFGCPPRDVVARLQAAGVESWVTVTEPVEAEAAEAAGARALVVQGLEAGAHRGSFSDLEGTGEIALLPLLRLVANVSTLPLVASGGIADGFGIAATLAAGARAAQLGTAFMGTDEAGTSAPHRAALQQPGRTALTRAFSGRRARGIVNGFIERHQAEAPSAYPEVHYLTSATRAAARERALPDFINLWAGQAYPLARHGVGAAEVVEQLGRELHAARRRLDALLG